MRTGSGKVASAARGWRLLIWLVAVGLFTFAVAMLLSQAFGASYEQTSSVSYGCVLAFALSFGLDSQRRSGMQDIHQVETLTWSGAGALRGNLSMKHVKSPLRVV